MVWTLLVVDYDVIYSDSEGLVPTVYAVPADKQVEAEHVISNTPKKFFENDCQCIGDIIEEELNSAGIPFKVVGDLCVEYAERQLDYLDDCIPHVII